MTCRECGRWIDQHETEARESGQCANTEKCEARTADPDYPEAYSAGFIARRA